MKKIYGIFFIFCFSCLFLVSNVTAETFSLGYSEIGTALTVYNREQVYRVNLADPVNITAMHVYTSSGTWKVRLAIFGDNGSGYPNELLWESDELTGVATSWVNVTSLNITASGSYVWFGVNSNIQGSLFMKSATGTAYYAAHNFGVFDPVFPEDGTLTTGQISLYADAEYLGVEPTPDLTATPTVTLTVTSTPTSTSTAGSTDLSQLWSDFMFGSTSFIAVGIFLAIAFLVTVKVKFAGIIFIPLCFFLGYEYLTTIEVNSVHMWAGVMACFGAFVELLIMIKGKD
jgi:hypothetical protein